MVNRVFCYSKEVAKKNGNKLPILQLILSTVIFIIGIMITAIVFTGSFAVFMIMMTVFMILLVYYSVVLGLRLRKKCLVGLQQMKVEFLKQWLLTMVKVYILAELPLDQ